MPTKKTEKNTARLAVMVPDEMLERLRQRAAVEDRSLSAVVRRLLEGALKPSAA